MIKELSSLRGIFILFIFLHHMSVFPGGGGLGVAFFFVLGGFAMTLGYHQKVMQPEFSYCSYLTKRAVKFYPLHWLCLLAVLPLCVKAFSWLTFTTNAALLHSWIPKEEFYFNYNTVSWYLANTLFFALVFPFLFRGVYSMNKQSKWISVFLLILVYFLLVWLIPEEKQRAFLYINPVVRLLDFLVGISAGLFFIKIKEKQSVKIVFEKHAKLLNRIVFVFIAAVVVLAFSVYLMGIKICPPPFMAVDSGNYHDNLLVGNLSFKWLNN